MIIDLTQLKKIPLTSEQKEAMIAKALETEDGRAKLLEALGCTATQHGSWMDEDKKATSYTPASIPMPEQRRNPRTGHLIVGARGDKTIYRYC